MEEDRLHNSVLLPTKEKNSQPTSPFYLSNEVFGQNSNLVRGWYKNKSD